MSSGRTSVSICLIPSGATSIRNGKFRATPGVRLAVSTHAFTLQTNILCVKSLIFKVLPSIEFGEQAKNQHAKPARLWVPRVTL